MTVGTVPAAEAQDPHVLAPDEAARLLRGHPFRRVVVLGDSVAAGTREPVPGYADLGLVDRLEIALRSDAPDLSLTNLGVSGRTIAEVAATQVADAVVRRPDLVVLSAGGNDAFARTFDPRRAAAGLTDLVRRLTGSGAPVVLVGLFDLPGSGLLPPDLAARMSRSFGALDDVMREVADAVPGCLLNDNKRHPLARDPSIFASDLLHCNARGHAVAGTTLVRDVATLVRAWA